MYLAVWKLCSHNFTHTSLAFYQLDLKIKTFQTLLNSPTLVFWLCNGARCFWQAVHTRLLIETVSGFFFFCAFSLWLRCLSRHWEHEKKSKRLEMRACGSGSWWCVLGSGCWPVVMGWGWGYSGRERNQQHALLFHSGVQSAFSLLDHSSAFLPSSRSRKDWI